MKKITHVPCGFCKRSTPFNPRFPILPRVDGFWDLFCSFMCAVAALRFHPARYDSDAAHI